MSQRVRRRRCERTAAAVNRHRYRLAPSPIMAFLRRVVLWCSARHVRHAQSRTDEREHAALADANAAEQPGWHQACGAVGAVINVPRQPGGSSGGEPSGKRSQVPRGGLMDAFKVGPTPLLFRG